MARTGRGNDTATRRPAPARVDVLRAAWAARVAAALPDGPDRSRLERRLARNGDGVFEHLARIDPTPRKVHLQRLCLWFAEGSFRIEDARSTRDLLVRFAGTRARLPVPERDLNRYRTPGDVEEALDRADGIVRADPLALDEMPVLAREQAIVVTSGRGWHIVRLDGPEASKFFADGTSWCTRHPDTFAGYRTRGTLYVLRAGKSRVQMHAPSGQLMDERNRPVEGAAIALLPAGVQKALVELAFATSQPGAVLDHSQISLACRLSGMGGHRHTNSGVRFRLDGNDAILTWTHPHGAEPAGLEYGLLCNAHSPSPRKGWIPPRDVMERAFPGPVPPELLLDFGPGSHGWDDALSDPDAARSLLMLCRRTSRHRHRNEAIRELERSGMLQRVVQGDPIGFPRAVMSNGMYADRDLVDAVIRSLPGPSDGGWDEVANAVARDPTQFIEATLERLRWIRNEDLETEEAARLESSLSALLAWLRAFSLHAGVRDAVAGAYLDTPLTLVLDLVRIPPGGMPGFVGALALRKPFADRLAERLVADQAVLFPALEGFAPFAAPEAAQADALLDAVGSALHPDTPALPGETRAATVARHCLSGAGILLPDGPVRAFLVSRSHPDFRTAYEGIVVDTVSRYVRPSPASEATEEGLGRLLALPGTGHLVGSLPPDRRHRLSEMAIAAGRGGILSVLPEGLATRATYGAMMGNPEALDVLERAAVTEAHVSAASAAGMATETVLRLRAAWFANGGGPAWLVAAAAAREAEGDLASEGYKGPEWVARRMLAGCGAEEALGGAIANSQLPVHEAYEAARMALDLDPTLVLRERGLAPALGAVGAETLSAHPGLLAHVRPVDVTEATTVRLAMNLAAPDLNRLGAETGGGTGAMAWTGLVRQLGRATWLGMPEARAVLGAFPLDPADPQDRETASRLLSRAGTVRPFDRQGRPWGAAAFASCLCRALLLSGMRLDRFLPQDLPAPARG